MQTQCKSERLVFQACGSREVVAEFNGGTITSDNGVLLLKKVEAKRKIIKHLQSASPIYHRSDDVYLHNPESASRAG